MASLGHNELNLWFMFSLRRRSAECNILLCLTALEWHLALYCLICQKCAAVRPIFFGYTFCNQLVKHLWITANGCMKTCKWKSVIYLHQIFINILHIFLKKWQIISVLTLRNAVKFNYCSLICHFVYCDLWPLLLAWFKFNPSMDK